MGGHVFASRAFQKLGVCVWSTCICQNPSHNALIHVNAIDVVIVFPINFIDLQLFLFAYMIVFWPQERSIPHFQFDVGHEVHFMRWALRFTIGIHFIWNNFVEGLLIIWGIALVIWYFLTDHKLHHKIVELFDRFGVFDEMLARPVRCALLLTDLHSEVLSFVICTLPLLYAAHQIVF